MCYVVPGGFQPQLSFLRRPGADCTILCNVPGWQAIRPACSPRTCRLLFPWRSSTLVPWETHDHGCRIPAEIRNLSSSLFYLLPGRIRTLPQYLQSSRLHRRKRTDLDGPTQARNSSIDGLCRGPFAEGLAIGGRARINRVFFYLISCLAARLLSPRLSSRPYSSLTGLGRRCHWPGAFRAGPVLPEVSATGRIRPVLPCPSYPAFALDILGFTWESAHGRRWEPGEACVSPV
jgi:hypothetical protein